MFLPLEGQGQWVFENGKEEIYTLRYSNHSERVWEKGSNIISSDDLKGIETAFVNNHAISEKEIELISELKGLKSLTIGEAPEGVKIGNNALDKCAKMKGLESVWLCKERLVDSDLHFLERLPVLKALAIEAPGYPTLTPQILTDNALKIIARITSLEELRLIRGTDFTDNAIKYLKPLTQLRFLEIASRNFTDRTLAIIANDFQLEGLQISSPKFTNIGVQELSMNMSLRKVNIQSIKLTHESVRYLSNISELTDLAITLDEIRPETMALIRGMESLRYLDLRNYKTTDQESKITDQVFRELKGHPALETLFLNGTALTEQSLGVFQSFPNLKYIDLGYEQIDPVGLEKMIFNQIIGKRE